MPEFLAETHTFLIAPGIPALCAADVARAAVHATGSGASAWFLGAVAIPEEEACFWLYKAPTAHAVRAAMTAAGLRPERITEAMAIRSPAPAPARSGTPTSRPPRSGRCVYTSRSARSHGRGPAG